LHNELFADYDCCACSNCCKTYAIPFLQSEVTVISRFLGKDENEFIDEYLVESDEIDCDTSEHKQYKTMDIPCPFLCDDGKCRIQDCKPSNCKDFPFTDKPDRLESMYAVLDFAEICPVVFEILERLKKLYRFTKRR
jgi:Fe-S-cluster containining protein